MSGNLDMGSNLILNIGNAGTDFTSGGGLTLAGTFTANGAVALGDGGDDIAINSNDWDISSTGVGTGFTSWTVDNIRIGYSGTNEIDTSSGNLVLDSTGGTVQVDDNLNITGVIYAGTESTQITNSDGTLRGAALDTDYEEEVHASEHAGNGLVNPSGDLLDVSTGWGLTTDSATDSVNLSSSVAGTGLNFNQGVLSVIYGSTAGTAAEGNKQITVSAGSGLTDGGTVTIGAGGSVTLNVGAGNDIDVSADAVSIESTLDYVDYINNLYGLCADSDGACTAPANGYIYAQRFADVVNTGYYVDPDGTSILSVVQINTRIQSNGDVRVDLDENNDGVNYFRIYDGGNTEIFRVSEGGSTWMSGSINATQFLDNDGNFVNPSGSSLINHLHATGDVYLATDSGRRVGIGEGSTTPTNLLDVRGNMNVTGNIYVGSGGPAEIYWDSSNSRLVIRVA